MKGLKLGWIIILAILAYVFRKPLGSLLSSLMAKFKGVASSASGSTSVEAAIKEK